MMNTLKDPRSESTSKPKSKKN